MRRSSRGLDTASTNPLGEHVRLREGRGVKYPIVIAVACGAACGVACGAAQHAHPRVIDGAIAGLARDHDSGDVIAKATIHVRPQGQLEPLVTTTRADGDFELGHLAPGKYSLTAIFAGQQVDVENIVVKAGDPTVVDVTFTLGKPDPIIVDFFGNAHDGAIDRFRPAHHAHDTALIEGTVNDRASRTRVAGAVVTAIGPGTGPQAPTLQAVSDDQGRYLFDPVPPGTYVVSAYYSVGNRGQIEVRRSDIEVSPAEGVIVPLWVETQR